MSGLRVIVLLRDSPERRLLAVAGPIALFANCVPAGLVLPMIIAAADDEARFRPDDLRPNGEALSGQAFGYRGGMQGAMPDIGNIAGEQPPGFAPVGAVVVLHLADAVGMIDAAAMTPLGSYSTP